MLSYSMHTRIECGAGITQNLPEFLDGLGTSKHLFLVSDPGVARAGVAEPVLARLRSAGYELTMFEQVVQNPRDTDCVKGGREFLKSGAGAVLGLGGGSAMDTAKAVALLGVSGATPQDYIDNGRPYESPVPVICVPTTAGTGSEVTRSAVITESATHRKMTLKHAKLRPSLAVLDPLLTVSVPPAVTAATGVDALVHAIEGYSCTLSNAITQAFGARAMRDIIPALPRAFQSGDDIEARSIMLQSSLLAGLCFGSSDVAAVHCLAEALGGLYDTPHGVANAIFLPHVLRYNIKGHENIHVDMARHMGFAETSDSPAVALTSMVDGIFAWTEELKIPRLRDIPGVNPADFDRLVDLAYANGSTPSNIRPIGKPEYLAILEEAYTYA